MRNFCGISNVGKVAKRFHPMILGGGMNVACSQSNAFNLVSLVFLTFEIFRNVG